MKSIRKIELKWSRTSLVRDKEASYSKQVKHSIDEVHEVIVVLYLDAKNKIIGYNEASRGGIDASAVTPADVFRPAVIMGCTAVILAHNHPSGDPKPSHEDVKFTDRIRSAGNILGVRVLDHIIIGDYNYYSFIDAGI